MTTPAQRINPAQWQDHILSQYRDARVVRGMAQAMAALLAEVVLEPLQLLDTYLTLDGAVGVWQERHGARLGLPKPLAATESQYTRLLKARKRLLVLVPGADHADAYLEDVFQHTDLIDAAFVDSISIADPASVRLFVRDANEGTAQLAIAAGLIPKPAGVRLEFGGAAPVTYDRGFPPAGSNPDDLDTILRVRHASRFFGLRRATGVPRPTGFGGGGFSGPLTRVEWTGSIAAAIAQQYLTLEIPADWLADHAEVATRLFLIVYDSAGAEVSRTALTGLSVIHTDTTDHYDVIAVPAPLDLAAGYTVEIIKDPDLT